MAGARLVGEATIQGALYQVDWYPAAVVQDANLRIYGEIYAVDQEMLAALDAYEGAEYRRVLVEPLGSADLPKEVWVYDYTESTHGLKRINSGDWLRWVSSGE